MSSAQAAEFITLRVRKELERAMQEEGEKLIEEAVTKYRAKLREALGVSIMAALSQDFVSQRTGLDLEIRVRNVFQDGR